MLSFFKKKVSFTSPAITINLDKLKKLLGGQVNIVNVQVSHIKIKVFLTSTNMLDLDAIKKLKGISGIFVASSYITIIVGKQAQQLANLLIKN